jgi:hypothetical protein
MTCRWVFKLWHDFIHKICGQLIHKTQDWHQHARRCLKITLGNFIELDQALRPLPGPLRTILSTKSVHKTEEPGEWSGDPPAYRPGAGRHWPGTRCGKCGQHRAGRRAWFTSSNTRFLRNQSLSPCRTGFITSLSTKNVDEMNFLCRRCRQAE